jgi:hypothetical protein
VQSQLVVANVVVAARQFNPTVFDEFWLLEHGIATREEFTGGDSFILTPPFVQFRSPRFVLLVMPEQLQFVPLPAVEDPAALVIDKVGTIIRLLPHTPFVAAGLNFHWQLVPQAPDFTAFCRALFFRNDPLFDSFDAEDGRFGGYMSKNIFGARLKLDIKPLKVPTSPTETLEVLQLVFNYNADLDRQNSIEQIEQILRSWNEAKDYAKQIVSDLENWQWK